MCSMLTRDDCVDRKWQLHLDDGIDVDACCKQDEEGEGDGDEDLPPLEEEGADEGSRMEEVD
jgi:hypothetical protein